MSHFRSDGTGGREEGWKCKGLGERKRRQGEERKEVIGSESMGERKRNEREETGGREQMER